MQRFSIRRPVEKRTNRGVKYLRFHGLLHELGGRHLPSLLGLLVETQQLNVEQQGVPRLNHASAPLEDEQGACASVNRFIAIQKRKRGRGKPKTPTLGPK